MDIVDLTSELKKFIKGDLITDPMSLQKYSRDTSIFEIKPSLIVAPKDIQDLQNLVAFVSKNKKSHEELSLTARAAGTDMSGGPLTDSIIVDFTKYFNHIKEVTKEYTVVEPGVYFRDLEKILDMKELLYPPYPASKMICAIGGIVNNNSAGEKTLQYGKTNKYILELEMILRDSKKYTFRKLSKKELDKKMAQKDLEGEIYKNTYKLITNNYELITNSRPQVSKNSSGYNIWDIWDKEHFDLTQIFCGAQGTLGLMTKAKLRLVSKPHHSKLYVVFMKNLNDLPQFVNEVLTLKPTSLEITDDHTFKIYLKYAREMASLLGSGGIINTIKLFMPETFLILRHGIPKLIVLVEFEGDQTRDLTHEIKQLEEIVKKYNLVGRFCRTKLESEKYWKLRRDTFKLLREKIKDKHSTPFVDDIIIKPETLPEFLPKLTAILDKYKIFYTISGHLGDGNLHIIPLMDLKKSQEREKIFPCADEVYKLVSEYQGSYSAEHNDGLIRSPYLKQQFGEKIYKIFKDLKQIFDPEGIFNPHKKVDATFAYAKSHMIKT